MDCTDTKDERSVLPPIARFCIDCAIKHIISNCPMNLENKGKVALNLVDLIPSPNSSKSKQVVLMNVVTKV